MIIDSANFPSIEGLATAVLTRSVESAGELALEFIGYGPDWLQYMEPITVMHGGVVLYYGRITTVSRTNDGGDKKTSVTAADFVQLLDHQVLGAQLGEVKQAQFTGKKASLSGGANKSASWKALADSNIVAAPLWGCSATGVPLQEASLKINTAKANTNFGYHCSKEKPITVWTALLNMKEANPDAMFVPSYDTSTLNVVSLSSAPAVVWDVQEHGVISISNLSPRWEDSVTGIAVCSNWSNGQAGGSIVSTYPEALDLGQTGVYVTSSSSAQSSLQAVQQASHLLSQLGKWYDAINELQYQGTITCDMKRAEPLLGSRLSLIGEGTHPDWATMNTAVTGETWDFMEQTVEFSLGFTFREPTPEEMEFNSGNGDDGGGDGGGGDGGGDGGDPDSPDNPDTDDGTTGNFSVALHAGKAEDEAPGFVPPSYKIKLDWVASKYTRTTYTLRVFDELGIQIKVEDCKSLRQYTVTGLAAGKYTATITARHTINATRGEYATAEDSVSFECGAATTTTTEEEERTLTLSDEVPEEYPQEGKFLWRVSYEVNFPIKSVAWEWGLDSGTPAFFPAYGQSDGESRKLDYGAQSCRVTVRDEHGKEYSQVINIVYLGTGGANTTTGGGTPPANTTTGGGTPPANTTTGGGTPPANTTTGGGTPPANTTTGGGTPPANTTTGGGNPPSKTGVCDCADKWREFEQWKAQMESWQQTVNSRLDKLEAAVRGTCSCNVTMADIDNAINNALRDVKVNVNAHGVLEQACIGEISFTTSGNYRYNAAVDAAGAFKENE